MIVGNGLKPLLFTIQLAFSKLYSNGIIIHILPAWVSYREHTNILNIETMELLPTGNMWRLTCKDLEYCLEQVKDRPHLILLNSPNNPTGYVYSNEELEQFAILFKKYNSIVLFDAIYEYLIYPKCKNAYNTLDVYYPEGTIKGSSLSKYFSAGGFRFGWLIFPQQQQPLYDACYSIASSVYTCPSTPLQYVATSALSFPKDIQHHLQFQIQMFQDIASYITDKLAMTKILFTIPQSAWYTLLDFTNYSSKMHALSIYNSDDLCTYFIDQLGLIMVSGSAFGIHKPFVLRYSFIDIHNIDVEQCLYNDKKIKDFVRILCEWVNA